jgi:hypothetical protein
MSLVHGNTNKFKQDATTWIRLNKHERLVKKDHKIRAGIEPTSSDNRSAVLPLNYPIFSPTIKIVAHPNIRSKSNAPGH